MDRELHFGGFILDACVGMGGGVIKKLIDAETDVFPRAGGDGRDNGAYGGLHGVVNSTGIVDEDASKFLAELHLSGGELASGSAGLRVLLFLSIYRGGVGVR